MKAVVAIRKMRLCAACLFTRESGFWHRIGIIFLIVSYRWLSKVSGRSQQEKASRDYDEQMGVRAPDLPNVSLLNVHQKFLETQEAAKLLKMDLWVMLHMSVLILLVYTFFSSASSSKGS